MLYITYYILYMIYSILSATVPELARHEVGVFGHRAKRVQHCERPTINDFDDLRSTLSMMDWSTINIRAARTTLRRSLRGLGTTFSASNFGFKIGRLSKPQNPAKIAQKAPKILPKTPPKRLQNDVLCCNPRKSKIIQPSHVFAHFWRSQTLENRPKIDAKTPSKSALCWIPSWNPKKYDSWY